VEHVVFSAQDASRADPLFLTEIFAAVIDAGATIVSIADTMSYAVPRHFGKFCKSVRTRTPGWRKVKWSVHCHNELGLAVANSLAAVENGIRQIECTVNGIGEGQGNTRLQGAVNALALRQDVFPTVRPNIVPECLEETSQLLTAIASSDRLPVMQ
jgi:2-isopropylmalate synthase